MAGDEYEVIITNGDYDLNSSKKIDSITPCKRSNLWFKFVFDSHYIFDYDNKYDINNDNRTSYKKFDYLEFINLYDSVSRQVPINKNAQYEKDEIERLYEWFKSYKTQLLDGTFTATIIIYHDM